MAEVLHVFDTPIYLDDKPYMAQVAGRPVGHVWEGWIEFAAPDGSDVRRTPRETTQPDRAALAYWATGLSGTYLEGAFRRALAPRPHARADPMSPPLFDAPMPQSAADLTAGEPAVLDPFSVGTKGEELLRRELGALRGWHLRNIVRAYELAAADTDLEALTEAQLVDLIVAAVQPA